MKKMLIVLFGVLAVVGCTNKMSVKEVEKEFEKLALKEYDKLKDANSFLNVVVFKLADLEKSGVNIDKIKNYETNTTCDKEKSTVEIVKEKPTANSKYEVKVTLSCK